jgi:hypothetical protein
MCAAGFWVAAQLEIGREQNESPRTLMTALELVMLLPLMARIAGRPEVTIGLIDGPVAIGHPDFENERSMGQVRSRWTPAKLYSYP